MGILPVDIRLSEQSRDYHGNGLENWKRRSFPTYPKRRSIAVVSFPDTQLRASRIGYEQKGDNYQYRSLKKQYSRVESSLPFLLSILLLDIW